MGLEDRPVLEPNAAGIDVGAREMFVAAPPGRDASPVRVFATFTEDLKRLTDWLEQCGVTTVALESTGVYWIPLYEILEQRGIRPCLVSARHMKNVAGDLDLLGNGIRTRRNVLRGSTERGHTRIASQLPRDVDPRDFAPSPGS